MVAGVLAIDIGGTKLAAAVVSIEGVIIVRDRIATPTKDPWPSLSGLIKRVQASSAGITLLACGVACGGPMKAKGELVSPLHIAQWRDFGLRCAIADLTGLSTLVDNDAKALALGEGWLGAGRDVENYMAVVIGTGVGAGLVLGGQLIDGRLGNAGHLGHVVVEPEGRPCRCGARGCLEAYVSGIAVESHTGRSALFAPAPLIEANGRYLGRAVASVAAVADISRVIVGGSVALGWGKPFFAAAATEFSLRSKLEFTRDLDIVGVGSGESAALIGAAAVALRGGVGRSGE